MNTWVWREQEGKRCWWVKRTHTLQTYLWGFLCLLNQLNTPDSSCCLNGGSIIPHVAPQQIKLLHSWSKGRVQLLCSAVLRKVIKRRGGKNRRSKAWRGESPSPFAVLFVFAERGAFPRLQLPHSNPSPSCNATEIVIAGAADEAAASRGSLITDLFGREDTAGFIYYKKQTGFIFTLRLK